MPQANPGTTVADDDDLEFVDQPRIRMRRSRSSRSYQVPALVSRVCALGASGTPLAAIDQCLHEEGAQTLPARMCCCEPARTCRTKHIHRLRICQLQGRPMAQTVGWLRSSPNPCGSRHRRPRTGAGGGSRSRSSAFMGKVWLCWQQRGRQAGCGCGRQEHGHNLGKGGATNGSNA